MILHLSYHAHLRRIERIERAALAVAAHGAIREGRWWGVFARWERLERLAWQQYRRGRQRVS